MDHENRKTAHNFVKNNNEKQQEKSGKPKNRKIKAFPFYNLQSKLHLDEESL